MRLSEREIDPEYKAIMEEQRGLWKEIAPALHRAEIDERMRAKYDGLGDDRNVYRINEVRLWLLTKYRQTKGRVVSFSIRGFFGKFTRPYPYGHRVWAVIGREVKGQVERAMVFWDIKGKVAVKGDRVFMKLEV